MNMIDIYQAIQYILNFMNIFELIINILKDLCFTYNFLLIYLSNNFLIF